MPVEDDILPLTKPIVGTSGRVYTELPIPKGTALTLSLAGYNLYIFSRNRQIDGALTLLFSSQEPGFVGSGCL